MSQGNLSRRLGAQDASFLYMEREEAPLHIGSIAVLEGDVSYEKLVETISAKLHLIPRYTQRVVPAPFNIGHPTWEWDPNFNIRNHIMEVRVDPPGADAQLLEIAGKLFAPMLDRSKPLWEMFLIRGIEGDRSAIASRVHHCLVDGVSGIEIVMILFDVSADPPPPVPPTEVPERGPIPVLRAVSLTLSGTTWRTASTAGPSSSTSLSTRWQRAPAAIAEFSAPWRRLLLTYNDRWTELRSTNPSKENDAWPLASSRSRKSARSAVPPAGP